METIYIIHIVKYSLRHMPEFTHAVGNLQEIQKVIIGAAFTKDGDFNNVYEIIAYASKLTWNENRDFQLIHSYEQQSV